MSARRPRENGKLLCGKCNRMMPLDGFCRNRARWDGLSNWCYDCRIATRQRKNTASVKNYPGYEALFDKQAGHCAVCGTDAPQSKDPRRKRFCVDHDHVTGQVRGLLCNRCNMALGHLEDDVNLIRALLKYIEEGGVADK